MEKDYLIKDEELWRLVSRYYAVLHDERVSNDQKNIYFNPVADHLWYYFAAAKKSIKRDFFDVTESEWEDVFQCSIMALWQTELEKWMKKYEKEKTSFFSFMLFNIRRSVHKIRVGRSQMDANVAYLYGKMRKISEDYDLPIAAENYHIFALILNKNSGNISIARIASTVQQWKTMVPLDTDKLDVINDGYNNVIVYSE